ncbi:Hsp20/alpha crystallin family protein [Candidatus Uhrbacteria bacterium]|nr:Hsp20/alpha crystallin family protein [Candidatus Uhrbacteria bacterium]
MFSFSKLFSTKNSSEEKKSVLPQDTQENSWGILEEGQLLIDMYERSDAIVVRSLVAGVDPQDLEIALHNDLLTIRGKREKFKEEIHDDRYYARECYWGPFSRTVVVPVAVDGGNIKATLKNGILVIELSKLQGDATIHPASKE